ncbi:MAG: hypothetical protein JNM56_21590 [Planctomycetia bacterium]|nr:hypothetical protein [Planctomycetia bacterium]
MAKDGLMALVCAGAVLVSGVGLSGLRATDDERNSAVSVALAVQTAMQQGRDYLQRGDARSAVFVLESQLNRVNGNPAYLALLRDAYRAYVKELKLASQEGDAQRYLQRLQVLDPGATLDLTGGKVASPAPPTLASLASKTALTPPPAKTAPPATPQAAPRPETKARAHGADEVDDPFRPENVAPEPKKSPALALLGRAEDEFKQKRYGEAAALFEQAHRADASAVQDCRDRWAYCKLHRVYELLNRPPAGGPQWVELEKEVRAAQELAPRLDYAKVVLAELEKRRSAAQTPALTVRHYPRGSDGWSRTETPNFRIYHNQSQDVAEQAAQIAERTRSDMGRKWFGGLKEDWNPRCDLFLHATAQDYSRVTGVAANSPGHSSIRSEGTRVLSRRIDLHCEDAANMLKAVLPHETTHVILAGQYGEQPVPRWADEGIAVLTEPRDKVERHLRNLTRCRQESTLFHVRQLMQLNDYPEPRRISAFYAQSVSLVDYLTTQKGPQVLTDFLRDAQKTGYEQALNRHYGFRTFDDLHQRWSQQAFGEGATAAAGAGQ